MTAEEDRQIKESTDSLRLIKKRMDSFKTTAIADYSQEEIEAWIEEVRRAHPGGRMFGIPLAPGHVWYRGRVCKRPDCFNFLRELIYPPEKHTLLGRANYANDPVFYASWNEPTMMSELNFNIGDFIYIISVRPREGTSLLATILGEYAQIAGGGSSLYNCRENEVAYRRMEHGTIFELIASTILDSFFAEQFSARVQAPFYQYKFTAAFARLILGMERTGLLYPSVCRRGGMNLAINPEIFDGYFEILEAKVIHVRSDFGYGMAFGPEIRRTASFAEDGQINWEAGTRARAGRTEYGELRPDQGVLGWRVPPRF